MLVSTETVTPCALLPAPDPLLRQREEKAREEGTVYRFKAMPLPSPGSAAGSASKSAPKRTAATQSVSSGPDRTRSSIKPVRRG